MSKIDGGIPVTSFISPTDSADTFPTHDAIYGKGGLREVDDITARNAIATQRRRIGMMVYVISEDKYYYLKNGIENTNWTEWVGGSGSGGDGSKDVVFVFPDGLTTGPQNQVQIFVPYTGTITKVHIGIGDTSIMSSNLIFAVQRKTTSWGTYSQFELPKSTFQKEWDNLNYSIDNQLLRINFVNGTFDAIISAVIIVHIQLN